MQKFIEKASIVAVIMVIITQTVIFFSADKPDLTKSYKVRGVPLENENYTFKVGEMELFLSDPAYGDEVYVLINGVKVSDFSENIVRISIKENDIIEMVNYSITNNTIKGKILYISDYFDKKYLETDFESDNGRVLIGRIFSKQPEL